jgi:hypothetical protein
VGVETVGGACFQGVTMKLLVVILNEVKDLFLRQKQILRVAQDDRQKTG